MVGEAAGSRKKLVSRATLKGFMRGLHGHDGHRGREGERSVRFFADFPVTWFLDDPLGIVQMGKEVSRATVGKKLVSSAALRDFIREMHGHAGHWGRLARFFSDFPVTWFLDDP